MLRPITANRWNRETAAHLLSRAGFGGKPEEIEMLVALGPEAAVSYLVDFHATPETEFPTPQAAEWDAETMRKLRELRKQKDNEEAQKAFREMRRQQRVQTLEMRAWWLERMASTNRPLQEKLTLFWHGHFATGIRKVKFPYLMYQQNETLRRHAAGSWREMLFDISRDPAMLVYLDNARSTRREPNENYAREIMELFSLGEGHYTEKDIKEAARAFTGWSMDRQTMSFRERAPIHDKGSKTFLGQTGNFTGEDIVRIICEQPQTDQFITSKMWRFFAETEPSKPLRDALAKSFRDSGQQFRPFLRTVFSSEEFYSPEVIGKQIKSPVYWLVNSVRLLERPMPSPVASTIILTQLGQVLFEPPNVKGWDGGTAWITTSNLLNRYNYASWLVEGHQAKRAQGKSGKEMSMVERMEARPLSNVAPAKVENLFSGLELGNAEKLMAAMQRRFLRVPLKPEREKVLRDYIRKEAILDEQTITHLTRLMMSTPEYQLT